MLNLTPYLRLYASYRRRQQLAASQGATQESQILKLVQYAANTKFGRDHGFSQIKSVADYQRQVPLRRYENFWKEYWQPVFPHLTNCCWPGTIPLFPVSSGTSSGTTKFIPCTQEMIKSNTKAGLDLLSYHVLNRPKSKIFGGKSFFLGGSTALKQEAPGIYSGDLSGITAKSLPWWAQMRYFPPADLALMSNWEEKIQVLAERSLKEDIRMLSGVPSWMLIFIDKLFELCPGRTLAEIYPNLEMVVHGGVNFAPYYERFKDLLSGSRAELREVYPASEGFIAVADRGYGEGLRLNTDTGIFYEFVPLEELEQANPTRHWVGNLESGVNYAVVLTTCAGLWSYIIGDTVRFVETATPRLLVTGRTSYMLSAFGEHLIGEEIEASVAKSASELGLDIKDFSVGAIYPEQNGDLGGHLYVIEFNQGRPTPEDESKFLKILDLELQRLNEDYAAHRAEGFGLNPPKLMVVEPGTFTAWMKSRGKLGGQNKVPRVINDQQLFKSLTQFPEAACG